MRQNGFFAYEIFSAQKKAVQILSMNVFFGYLFISIYLVLFVLLWRAKADKFVIIAFGLVAAIVPVVFIFFGISSGRYDLVAGILIFCILLSLCLLFWISSGFSEKANYWWIPLALSAAFIISPIALYGIFSTLTESALSQMKVGGIKVELSTPLGFGNEKPEKILSAKLLLRTPDFYYLRPTNSSDSVLIVRTEDVSLKYIYKFDK